MSINTSSYSSTVPQGICPLDTFLERLISNETTTSLILSPCSSSSHSYTYLPTSESFGSPIPPTIDTAAQSIFSRPHSASSSLPVFSTPIPCSKDPLPEGSLNTHDTSLPLTFDLISTLADQSPAQESSFISTLADQSPAQESRASTKKRKTLKERDEARRKRHRESETLRRKRNKLKKLQLIEDQKRLITMVKDFDGQVKDMFSLVHSPKKDLPGIDFAHLDKTFGNYVDHIPTLFNTLITQVQQNQSVQDHRYTHTQVKGHPGLLKMATTVAACVNFSNKEMGESVPLLDLPKDPDAATQYYATYIPPAIIQMVRSHRDNLTLLQIEILKTRARECELIQERQRLMVENLRLKIGMSQLASTVLKRDDSSSSLYGI